LAGPMRGIPRLNFPAFNAATKLLRAEGHEVFNPAEEDIKNHGGVDISLGNMTGDEAQATKEHGFSLRKALPADTGFISLQATGIAMLPGWEGSKGANAEHALAHALGHTMRYLRASEFEGYLEE